MELLALLKWATGILGVSVAGLLIKVVSNWKQKRNDRTLGKLEGLTEGREKAQEKCESDKKLIWSAHKQEIKIYKDKIETLEKEIERLTPPITDVQ